MFYYLERLKEYTGQLYPKFSETIQFFNDMNWMFSKKILPRYNSHNNWLAIDWFDLNVKGRIFLLETTLDNKP